MYRGTYERAICILGDFLHTTLRFITVGIILQYKRDNVVHAFRTRRRRKNGNREVATGRRVLISGL